MYSTELDSRPSRPVTKSLSAAQQEFRLWLLANDFSHLTDKAGHVWQVGVKMREQPSLSDHRRNDYHVELSLQTSLSAADLVAEKTLDTEKDGRLIHLIYDAKIPVVARTRSLHDTSFRSLRLTLVEQLRRWREYLESHTLDEVKRQLVGQWIDRQARFENRGHADDI